MPEGYVATRDPIVLTVPDDLDIAAKHRMPAVLQAIGALVAQKEAAT